VDFVLKDPKPGGADGTNNWPAFARYPELAEPVKPWTQGFLRARDEMPQMLFLCNGAMASMLASWAAFVDLPIVPVEALLAEKGHMDLVKFQKVIMASCDTNRKRLATEWLDTCRDTFADALAARQIRFADMRGYWEACGAVMNAQLRALAQRTLAAFVELFCPAKGAPVAFKGFTVRMLVDDDQIRYDPEPEHIEKAVTGLFHKLLGATPDFPRIESLLGDEAPVGIHEQRLGNNLPPEYVQPLIAQACAAVRERFTAVTEYSHAYDPHVAYITRTADTELSALLDAEGNTFDMCVTAMRHCGCCCGGCDTLRGTVHSHARPSPQCAF